MSTGTARKHVGKACERCRQQKIKCNGESPCSRCVRLSAPCVIRKVARQRQKSPKTSADDRAAISVALDPVRVKNELGRIAVYGPTSTLALLRAIMASRTGNYAQITTGDSSNADDVLDLGSMSMDALRFNLLSLQNYSPSPAQGLSLTPPLSLVTIPNGVLQSFLHRYVDTAWVLIPMQSPDQLGALFSSSYTALSQNTPPPALYPVLLYQLALGSVSTEQAELAEMLAGEGELFSSDAGFLPEEFELQLSVLMVEYYSDIGSFDKAYSLLGRVMSRVYTAGFHLEPQSLAVKKLLSELIARERFICIALGRPPIVGANIQVCDDDASPQIKFFSDLFSIISPGLCARQAPSETFDQLWNNVWATHTRLQHFWAKTEPLLRLEYPDSGGANEKMELSIGLYGYAVLMNLRPLLLYLGYQTTPHENSKPGRTGDQLHDSNPQVMTAIEHILSSAQSIISIVCGVCERGSAVKALPTHSFFLETACLTLISYGLWRGDLAAVWDSLTRGIQCLESLQYQRVAAMRLASVRAALEQSGLGVFGAEPLIREAQSSVQGQDITASGLQLPFL
ncbi:hypothetical protein BJX61DRAFT_495508 [Aspergillus egyptiacus]|nr:hypothetical protein BJX61DRAFT_495508 [Aspergillus egyptiacus]